MFETMPTSQQPKGERTPPKNPLGEVPRDIDTAVEKALGPSKPKPELLSDRKENLRYQVEGGLFDLDDPHLFEALARMIDFLRLLERERMARADQELDKASEALDEKSVLDRLADYYILTSFREFGSRRLDELGKKIDLTAKEKAETALLRLGFLYLDDADQQSRLDQTAIDKVARRAETGSSAVPMVSDTEVLKRAFREEYEKARETMRQESEEQAA